MEKSLLERAKTLEPQNPNKSTGLFGGQSSGILNWNDIAYPHWYKMYKRLLGNYWQADEVNMSGDVKQFSNLTAAEQEAYLKIIGLLSTLDAPQTRTALKNKMVGTSTMISYINRHELEHGRFIDELFRATLAENPEQNTSELTEWVYTHFQQSVELEIEWSHYVLQDVEGIDLDEMAGYIKYRANKMLRMMGLHEIYPEHVENPMKWIRAYVDNFDGTKTDFFEQKSRQYTKTSDLNGFDDL